MDETQQQKREHILSHIPDLIRSILQTVNPTPIRILGDVPNRILDASDYLESIRPIVSLVQDTFYDVCPEGRTCFLAVRIQPGRHAYFVVDFNNNDYVYETAHNDMTPIPIYVLRLSMRPKIFRQQGLDQRLGVILAGLHNSHGQAPLPFFDDYNQLIVYANPRRL